jgi:putative ABC transport system ATP-binding protein
VFQDYALIPDLDATENVIVPLLMRGLGMREAHMRAMRALERVGLGDRGRHCPSKLSGGEQQRVSIARAIAHDPVILFADEPTANLDSETAENILGIFRELHRAGQTIVMVTHEKEYGARAERIIHLQDGRILPS